MSTNDDSSTSQLEALTEQYLRHLEEGSPAPSIDSLPAALRDEARQTFAILDATWNTDIDLPAFEDDPVAIRLGFVGPPTMERTLSVDGAAVKQVRQLEGLDVRRLAQRISDIGGAIPIKDLAAVERQSVTELPERTVALMADALGKPATVLLVDPDTVSGFIAFLYSPRFDAEVAAWCETNDMDVTETAVTARQRVLAGQRRSQGSGNVEDWVGLLRAVLESLL
jgi:hypothetical protein